jgi:hypothetical protein
MNDREKDRFLRQLEFMEAELKTLRKTLADKSEKFYEEKRSLQSKIRDLESSVDSASIGSVDVSPSIAAIRNNSTTARSEV